MFEQKRSEGEALNKFAQKPLLRYPDFNEAVKTLEITYGMSAMNERACLVTGEPGVGKSTIAESVNYHLNKGYDSKRPRSVYVKLNSPKTIREFTEQMSNGLVTLRRKVSKTELNEQLRKAFINQGIEVLVLDEIQTLLPAVKESALARDMADAIKHLMEQLKLSVFMFGVEDASRLYDAEKYKKFTIGQLVSRSNATVRLKTFKNDEVWIKVLEYMDKHTYLPTDITLSEPKVAALVYEATKGNFRDLNNLIGACHTLYDLGKVKSLSVKTLALAYNHENSKEVENNPFLEINEQSIGWVA